MEKGGIIKHDPKKSSQTGDWRYMKPEVNTVKCIGCGTCVPYCPEAAMELISRKPARNASLSRAGGPKVKSKKLVDIDFVYCKGCGVCAEICPVKAIIMKK